ncbi:MAG TPA: glucokinase [bacterium]|nr:glucokinase [bacterium]
MLLAGDIGGTKTALGIFTPDAGPRSPLAQATFPSHHYPSLEAIIEEFLRQTKPSIDRASFGVAGPVINGVAKITNVPWTVDDAALGRTLRGAPVRVVNDLVAIASAVPALEASDRHTVNRGTTVSGGAIGIVAPGTGLGEAFLTWDGGRYRAYPSEGGHADFAPRTPVQRGLLAALARDGSHVSYERVCSGLGIPHIYAYLRDNGAAPEPAWLAQELAAADDPTPVIMRAALEHEPPSQLAADTLGEFVAILGAEAGNLALKVLATGGVYLGGGIPPRITASLEDGRFMQAFTDKGRLSTILSAIPVHVITHPGVALVGAACVGLDLPTRPA